MSPQIFPITHRLPPLNWLNISLLVHSSNETRYLEQASQLTYLHCMSSIHGSVIAVFGGYLVMAGHDSVG